MTNTIRMTRDHGEPRTADVHPAEVENYRAAGFEAGAGDAPAAARLDPAFAKFDGDHDGKPGGSLPKAKRAPKRKAK